MLWVSKASLTCWACSLTSWISTEGTDPPPLVFVLPELVVTLLVELELFVPDALPLVGGEGLVVLEMAGGLLVALFVLSLLVSSMIAVMPPPTNNTTTITTVTIRFERPPE